MMEVLPKRGASIRAGGKLPVNFPPG